MSALCSLYLERFQIGNQYSEKTWSRIIDSAVHSGFSVHNRNEECQGQGGNKKGNESSEVEYGTEEKN